ncbi:hypothetical protein HQ560_02400, partial [bacterium]|nr:hypothetical protein [bacterium]
MRFILPAILLLACCAQAAAPLARNVVEQEGGADAAQYLRRTVTWWPRLNQDTTKPPADGMRLWRPKEGKPFKAAWVQTLGRNSRDGVLAAVLLTEDGRKRAVPLFEVDRGDKRVWKLDNGESIEDEPTYIFRPLFSDEGMAYVKSRGAKAASTAKSVKYADQWDRYKKLDATARSHINEGRTPHFRILWGDAMPKGGAGRLFFSPDFRKMNFDYVEQIWDFFSVDMGAQMPYARKDEKFKINVYTFSTGLPGMGGGWAYGAKQLLMNPGAMREGSSVIPHEFNHCLQFHSPAFRNKHSGWFWECHANWGTHQFIPNLAPVLALYANTAHFDIRSNRHHYGNWMFVQCMAENPLMGTAFCYGIWYTADPKKEDPFIVIMRFGREKGLWKNGPKGFGDVIGEMAARNVTWDYVHQRAYATAMARASSSSIAGHARTVLEPVPDRAGWFRPPLPFAPM